MRVRVKAVIDDVLIIIQASKLQKMYETVKKGRRLVSPTRLHSRSLILYNDIDQITINIIQLIINIKHFAILRFHKRGDIGK